MKVFHMESGLGNQMLDYADLLAARKANPQEKFYIETLIYECAQDVVCMWQGYELERIFGIKERNVRELFSSAQWQQIIADVNKSEFWKHNWAYTGSIIQAFARQNVVLQDRHPRVAITHKNISVAQPISKSKYLAKRLAFTLIPKRYENEFGIADILFKKSNTDDLDGHYLRFKYKGNGIERIEADLRRAFTFPAYDEKNFGMSRFLRSVNSVAIHARRGDLLGQNGYCYKYGYFKRAVSFIKKQVKSPVFVFFCDPSSVSWSRENLSVFGLNAKDQIYFVDWNKGDTSFRDMQLMTDCKHNIITESTFGWWGAYLNQNPDKITCSPDIRLNTTHWF